VHLKVNATVDVEGHADSIRQIVLNLLENAVKYGPTGQQVTVTVDADGQTGRIIVDDQGPGIPPRDRARIFEPFFRLPRDENGESGGSGIGLAVVSELAAAQQATVAVDDAPRGGARIIVRFRLLPPADDGTNGSARRRGVRAAIRPG
jgi:signal transduction histidine kinase